jgi:colicin import membrane protein
MSKLLITLAAATFVLASTPAEAQSKRYKEAWEKAAKAEAAKADADKADAAKAAAAKSAQPRKKGKSKFRDAVAKARSDAEKGSVTTK